MARGVGDDVGNARFREDVNDFTGFAGERLGENRVSDDADRSAFDDRVGEEARRERFDLFAAQIALKEVSASEAQGQIRRKTEVGGVRDRFRSNDVGQSRRGKNVNFPKHLVSSSFPSKRLKWIPGRSLSRTISKEQSSLPITRGRRASRRGSNRKSRPKRRAPLRPTG